MCILEVHLHVLPLKGCSSAPYQCSWHSTAINYAKIVSSDKCKCLLHAVLLAALVAANETSSRNIPEEKVFGVFLFCWAGEVTLIFFLSSVPLHFLIFCLCYRLYHKRTEIPPPIPHTTWGKFNLRKRERIYTTNIHEILHKSQQFCKTTCMLKAR